VTSGFGAEDGKGQSGDRTRELLELVRPRAFSRASSPQVPACGGFWRLAADKRQRLHYSAAILVWPLLWPL
jgi:hypothetical protein